MSIKTSSVSAVVVTYNRSDELTRCIDGLKDQVRRPECVIIVDNASTDNTVLSLTENGFTYNSSLSQRTELNVYSASICQIDFILVSLQENQGGAGGFYIGQTLAFQLGYEFIWLMDDDGCPDVNCLHNLLAAVDKQPHCTIVNPLVLNEKNNNELAFGLSADIETLAQALEYSDSEHMICGLANPFNGTLIHRQVIEKIGFVKREMFIWGDEVEYLERAKVSSIGIYTACNARFYHPVSKTKKTPAILGLLYIHEKPRKLEMNYYRNAGYLHRNFFAPAMPKYLIRHVLYFLLNLQFEKLTFFLKYYWDGYTNRFKLPNIKH